MNRKDTNDLKQELMVEGSLDRFLEENRDSFPDTMVQERLLAMVNEKGISKAVLAKQAGMSEVYLHQVIAGRRNPSRNRLICLCFGMSASLEECQTLLKHCGMAQLYPHKRRDAIIIYGLLHGLTLFEVNDKLFVEEEDTLY